MTDELSYTKAFDAFVRAQGDVREATELATKAQIVLSNALSVESQAARVLQMCERIALGGKTQAVSR